MGAWVNFTNHIEIANESWESGAIKYIGYKDITEDLFEEIVNDLMLKRIQIHAPLPTEAFYLIDKMLSRRPDMYFRIYGLYGVKRFDLSVLRDMKSLKNLWIDADLRDNLDLIDCNILSDLAGLKELKLMLFDLRDYSFMQNMSKDIEKLSINADTTGGSINFDYKWLLRYSKLNTLAIGKKAKKNIDEIRNLPELRDLKIGGIKLKDFEFLREINLESLAIQWCGMPDLSSLRDFHSLKHLELWRIMKLEDISFISTLSGLESLSLQDLKHITSLPDMSKLVNLHDIKLDNVPVKLEEVPDHLRSMIHR